MQILTGLNNFHNLFHQNDLRRVKLGIYRRRDISVTTILAVLDYPMIYWISLSHLLPEIATLSRKY